MTDHAIHTEAELVLQFKSGSHWVFTELYERYFSQLYIHAYNKLGDREAAKDIVQDLFTRLWEKRSELQITGSFSSYLYTAIRNRVIDYMARQSHQHRYAASLSQYADSYKASDVDHKVRAAQMAERIEQEIAHLPPRLKEVITLSRAAGLSNKAIARELNLSEHTVKNQVKTALKLLRAKLTSLLWSLV